MFVGKEIRAVNKLFFKSGMKAFDDGVVVRTAFMRKGLDKFIVG